MTETENTQQTTDTLPKYMYLPSEGIVQNLKALVEKKKNEQLERERLASMPKEPYKREEPRIGRNDPCPCGSGKKYKKCHLLLNE